MIDLEIDEKKLEISIFSDHDFSQILHSKMFGNEVCFIFYKLILIFARFLHNFFKIFQIFKYIIF